MPAADEPGKAPVPPRLSSFFDARFKNADWSGGTLVDVDFGASEFVGCDLSGARLDRCGFEGCRFERCDVSRVELGRSQFTDVTFVDCRLTGLDWPDAAIGVTLAFERCVLDHSSFLGLNLQGLEVRDCRARSVKFSEADLTGADFKGTDLRRSRFNGADLTRADLSEASSVELDPAGSELNETRLPLSTALSVLRRLGIVVPGLSEEDG